VANNFTAKATTSSGGSATQSWTVTPTGTVTVHWAIQTGRRRDHCRFPVPQI
jgi:hypothetical protein